MKKKQVELPNTIGFLKVLSLFWTEAVRDVIILVSFIIISTQYIIPESPWFNYILFFIVLGLASKYALRALDQPTIDEHQLIKDLRRR